MVILLKLKRRCFLLRLYTPAAAPARIRVHNLDAQVNEVEEIDVEETEIERLTPPCCRRRRFCGRVHNCKS